MRSRSLIDFEEGEITKTREEISHYVIVIHKLHNRKPPI